MRARTLSLAAIAAALLLTGCGASPGTHPTVQSTTHPATSSKPSVAAQMICSDDIMGKVKQVLKLRSTPATHTTFVDQRFTCTYDLPMGPLALSVKDSPGKPAAGAYFTALRPTLGATESLIGLGEKAYGTSTGTVVVLKDSQTLRVDATGLPPVFGSEGQKRTDLAYEIASDVLGCWTEG